MDSPTQAAVFVKSERGGAKLIHEGHMYRVHRVNADKSVSWKCHLASNDFKCPGRVKTTGKEDGAGVFPPTEHSHMPDPSRWEALKVKRDIAETSLSQPASTPVEVVATVTAPLPGGTRVALPPKKSLKEIALKARRMKRKRALEEDGGGDQPNESSRTLLNIPQSYSLINDETFLLRDIGQGEDRILIFGTQGNVEVLASADTWGADGTFKICPAIFCQVYTIHAHQNGFVLPCLYCLLPDKSRGTYARMWEAVKELLPEGRYPKTVITDFEVGAYVAAVETFPDAEPALCYFHLGQSVDRKVNDAGLKQRYADDAYFRIRVKSMCALAFLSPEKVPAAFGSIEVQHRDDEIELVQYFESNYIGRRNPNGNGRRNPRYPLTAWNVYERRQHGRTRTNNSVEAFHRAMGSGLLRSHHLSM